MRQVIYMLSVVVLFTFSAEYALAQDSGARAGAAGIPGRSDSIAGEAGGGFDTVPGPSGAYPGLTDVPDQFDEALDRWARQRSTAVPRPGLAPGQSGTTGKSATAPLP